MTTDDYGKKLLEYMRLNMQLKKCDVIIGLGSMDSRVAQKSAQLFLNGYADLVIFCGGFGRNTSNLFKQTEAETFKNIAIKMGVPENKILLEPASSNTGENVRFTEKLAAEKGIDISSMIVVTKPYMERRAFATFKKQWSDKNLELIVTSPNLTYEEHFNDQIPKELFLNVMVSDMQRIKEYPKLGYQIEQEIPADVWSAYEALVAQGYDKQKIKG